MEDLFKNMIIMQLLSFEKQLGKKVVFNPLNADFCYTNNDDGKLYSVNSKRIYDLTEEISLSLLNIDTIKTCKKGYFNDILQQYFSDISNEKYQNNTNQHQNNTNQHQNNQSFQELDEEKQEFYEEKRQISVFKTNLKGEVIGIKSNPKYHLFDTLIEKKSHLYEGDTQKVLRTIENKLNQIIENNKSRTNILDVEEFHKKCIFLANKNNYRDLGNKLKEANDWIVRQKKGHTAKHSKLRKQKGRNIKRKVGVAILMILAFSIMCFFAVKKIQKNSNSSYSTTEIEEKKSYSPEECKCYIDTFCNQQDTILTDFRTKYIVSKTANIELTKTELLLKINFYSKYEN